MHPRVKFRDATKKDIEAVRRVSLAAHAEYAGLLDPVAWERLERGLSSVAKLAEAGTVIVAESQDGSVVGSVVYFAPGSSSLSIFEPG